MSLLIQVHTITKELKGTCIYYGVIHTTILVQSEEGEERSALSEEDHTGLATTGGSPVEPGQRSTRFHTGFFASGRRDFVMLGTLVVRVGGIWA